MVTLDLSKSAPVLNLTKESPGLKNVKILLNWDPHPVHGANSTTGFDLDLWGFGLDTNGKIIAGDKILYFNNMNVGSGAMVLPRDNRTGEGDDDEEILINLEKFKNSGISKAALYVFIYQGTERGQHFGMIANAAVKVINSDTGEVIAQYNITQDCNGATALCIGMIDNNDFTPDGGSGNMEPNEVLQHYS